MFTSHINFENASALHQQGQWVQARTICEHLLAAEPHHADALHLMGVIEYQSGHRERAAQFFSRAIQADTTRAEFYVNHANVAYELQQFAAAVASYNQAIAITPNDAVVYLNRGIALTELNQWQAAADSFSTAVSIKPDFAEGHFNLGNALRELKRFQDSVTAYDHAITIKPDYVEAYFNRGIALLELKEWDAAVENYERTIAIKADYANAYINRGIALTELKQWEAAINNYDQIIAIKPDFADAYYNKALLLLTMKRFEQGWQLYDWRYKLNKLLFYPVKITNYWDGQKRQGSLLVLPEQGMGDEIFYSGMLNDLRMMADNIAVCVDARLVTLYQRSFPDFKFIPKESLSSAQGYDAQIYMGSLGRYFRVSEQAIQKNVNIPFLKACPDQTKQLRTFLSDNKLICGLSWISKNKDLGADKSLQLSDLKSVLALPEFEFVDLQYGDTTAEKTRLFNETGIKLTRVAQVDHYSDIDGLASLIDACDVIVTISNTTAHLAAALGKHVIVMLPYARGLLWYWHEESDQTPWYPTAKLVRQSNSGDWAGVTARVKNLLHALV